MRYERAQRSRVVKSRHRLQAPGCSGRKGECHYHTAYLVWACLKCKHGSYDHEPNSQRPSRRLLVF